MTTLSRREVLATMASVSALGMLGGCSPGSAPGAKEPTNEKGYRYRGVVYDVGLRFADVLSVEPFNPAQVKHDIRVIAKELHCNAVRIEGEPIDRLVTTAREAHSHGMTVFFNPWKMNVGADETRAYYADAAVAAEKLRQEGVDIIFVAGCEYTIFNVGLYPGKLLMDRIQWLMAQFANHQFKSVGDYPPSLREKNAQLNELLRSFAQTVRGKFKGRVTYAATGIEAQDVDWSVFDIIGVDYYRHGETDAAYLAGLDLFRRGDKPVVVMEVGSCAYEGAAAKGSGGFMVLQGVNKDGSGNFPGGVPKRSESEQAGYVGQQLEILSTANVHGIFIYVFSFPLYRTGEGAKDLDMVSFSLVKTFPEHDPRSKQMPPWAPKEAFHRVADFYKRYAARGAARSAT